LKELLEKFHFYWLEDWKYFSTDSMMTSSENKIKALALPEVVLRKLYYENALNWYPGIK
ncbi:hypothetical protein MNBD_IGNAVI01-1538, partial [hydrothermal vent metagenome]